MLIIPLIEHPNGVENIDEICALHEVRILVFGASDLAYALGAGGQMQDAYRHVLESAQRHGVAVMSGLVFGGDS